MGLPIIQTDTEKIEEGDELIINLMEGKITVVGRNLELKVSPFPSSILEIIKAGGLVEYFKKYGEWKSS